MEINLIKARGNKFRLDQEILKGKPKKSLVYQRLKEVAEDLKMEIKSKWLSKTQDLQQELKHLLDLKYAEEQKIARSKIIPNIPIIKTFKGSKHITINHRLRKSFDFKAGDDSKRVIRDFQG